MESSKKLVKYISNSLTNLSSIIFNNSSEDLSRKDISALEFKITDQLNVQSLDSNLSWSKDSDCNNDTVVLQKGDYERLKAELAYSQCEIKRYKWLEREYKKKVDEYDRTMTYILDKEENNVKTGSSLNSEINRLRYVEQRLNSHIKALKRDLFSSEARVEDLKRIASSELDNANQRIEKLELQFVGASKRVCVLESMLEDKCKVIIELVEYCKFLTKNKT